LGLTNAEDLNRAYFGGDMGGGLLYRNYKEYLTLPQKSVEKGTMLKFYMDFSLRKKVPSPYGRVRLISDGPLGMGSSQNYEGTTKLGVPLNNLSGDIGIDFETDFGLALIHSSWMKSVLTFYSGYGFYALTRVLWDGANGNGQDYGEDYEWQYVPMGILWEYSLSKNWEGAIDISRRNVFGTKMAVTLGNFDSTDVTGKKVIVDYPVNLRLKFASRPGWKFAVHFYYKNFSISPWYQFTPIGASNYDTLSYGPTTFGVKYEPSRIHQIGLQLGARDFFRRGKKSK
jgi:hypothetical protein